MNERDFNTSVIIPNLAVLVLVAIGLFSEKSPLTSNRPSTVALDRSIEANARLWQDPFSVAQPAGADGIDSAKLLKRYEEAATGKKRAWTERHATPAATPAPAFRVLILPVLLDEKNYPETRETRLRTRYAVLSALGRAQYVPVKADRMEFVTVDCSSPGSKEPCTVPFEDFGVRYLVADNVDLRGHENNWLYDVAPTSLDPAKRPAKMLSDRSTPERVVVAQPFDRVVVVWLEEGPSLKYEDGAETSAARAFDATIDRVVAALLGKSASTSSRIGAVEYEIKAIGPTNSDRLVGLLEHPAEAEPRNESASKSSADSAPATPSSPAKRTLLSPRASAAPTVLQISLSRKADIGGAPPAELPQAPRWKVRRTIGTDDTLVAALLKELEFRGAMPDMKKHLVLVGEWDTLYSRGIGRAFAAKLNVAEGLEYQDRATWSANPGFLHEFSYLRGLDGQVESSGAGKSSGKKPADKERGAGSESSTGNHDLERAEGESQFDYLRRIEESLRRLQQKIAGAGAEIRSIGIIGSDTYDKLLVLRALSASFPRAVFFTTDLDAIYLDHAEQPFTTNMVVAAPFGLAAADPLQNRIPPFRDSYQTALFLTVLQAVGVTQVGESAFTIAHDAISPRIFEIGRTSFRDLSNDEELTDKRAQLQPSIERPKKFHRREGLWFGLTLLFGGIVAVWACLAFTSREISLQILAFVWLVTVVGLVTFAAKSGGSPGWIIIIALGLSFVFYVVSEWITPSGTLDESSAESKSGSPSPVSLRRRLEAKLHEVFGRTRATKRVWACAVIFAGLFAWSLWSLHNALSEIRSNTSEEPFAWFDGVSIWPTEIVRLAAAVVAIVGIVGAQRRLREMRIKITRTSEYCLTDPTKALENWKWRASWTSLQQWWLVKPITAPRQEPTENDWWTTYCVVTTQKYRFVRVVICMTGYFVIFLLLALLGNGTIVPARGEWSHALDRGVLAGAVLSYTYLLFFVLDVTIMTASLIRKLEGYIGRRSHLEDGLAVHLIEDLTNVVAGLIYLPFTVLFMMIVSRNTLFDRWEWPPLLLGIFGTALVMIMFAALLLQQRARHARQIALDWLDRQLLRDLISSSQPQPAQTSGAAASPKSHEDSLRELRAQITSFNGVAFQSWHQNPIFRAILIPLGGLGSLQLLEKVGTLL